MLPSKIDSSTACDKTLQRIEWRLCIAQAHDALHSLQSNLHAQMCVLKYKDRYLHGQGANTRAHNTLKGIEHQINTAANRYNDAYKALVKLALLLQEMGWNTVLRPLIQQDICGLTDLLWGETKGTRKLSWIWSISGVVGRKSNKAALEGPSLIFIL
ncbi:hypothetical protein JVU11DRAFT_10732 [Chiua virens]|nr:hypothetical protein JVU11DRAFT_10732 [Chiua virens]